MLAKRVMIALLGAIFGLTACQSGSSSAVSAENLYETLAEGGIYCDGESIYPYDIYVGASEAVCDSETLGRFTVVFFEDRDAMVNGLQETACPSQFSDLTSYGSNYFVLFYPPRETLDAVSKALGGKTGTAAELCDSL